LLATWHPGDRQVVRIWDVRTGKEVRSFPETKAGWPGQLSFAADGKTLFVAGGRVAGYDPDSGKELFSWQLKPPRGTGGSAPAGAPPLDEDDQPAWRTLAVSADGAVVAAILLGGGAFNRERVANRIVLCDARTGRELGRCNDSGMPSRRGEHLAFSPDGRLLASSDGESVHVWEVLTTGKVCTFRGHRGEIRSLAFSGDDRRLASASCDSTVLIWDLPLALRREGTTGKPGEKEIAAWWEDLASADAGRAYAAVWGLADVPGASVPLLGERLRPVTEAEVKEVRRYIADLDSDTFAVRKKAFEQLDRLGPAAEPALRKAREKGGSPEVRRRVEELLDRLGSRSLSAEPLRTLRALAVLEHEETPEARRLLRELAGGAAGAWLTQEAQAAQARVTRQSAGRP
jgi:hypothetical protein